MATKSIKYLFLWSSGLILGLATYLALIHTSHPGTCFGRNISDREYILAAINIYKSMQNEEYRLVDTEGKNETIRPFDYEGFDPKNENCCVVDRVGRYAPRVSDWWKGNYVAVVLNDKAATEKIDDHLEARPIIYFDACATWVRTEFDMFRGYRIETIRSR
jgi:hypothetical protein